MILIPIGTKAQLIKMAPVLLALKKMSVRFDFVLTGQHQETIDDLIEGFGLPAPAYTLTSIGEADSTAKVSRWLLRVLWKHCITSSKLASRPYKVCLVHGDTLSTFVGALLAKRHGIKVAHVEAGLRSHNFFHPFPEELTRIAVSKMSDIFYCSGSDAIKTIKNTRENADIIDIGQNTLLDSVRVALEVEDNKAFENQEHYCVVSIHRFENISNEKRLIFITDQLVKIAARIKVKFVLHAATKNKLENSGLMEKLKDHPSIHLLPRMSYFKFINLLRNSYFLVSDGGSNQEECSYLDIPCILMRNKTERSEGLGENVVLSEYKTDIIDEFVKKHSQPRKQALSYLTIYNEQPSNLIANDLKLRLDNWLVDDDTK